MQEDSMVLKLSNRRKEERFLNNRLKQWLQAISSKIIIEVNPKAFAEIRELSGSMSKRCGNNEQGLPRTGKVDEQGLLNLLEYSEISVGAYEDGELLGYVICLPPATEYGSLNYAWFNENMADFLYVDRIVRVQIHRDKGIGSRLYSHIIEYSGKQIAEVPLNPPNLASMRFHGRFDFEKIGELHHNTYSVNLDAREQISGALSSKLVYWKSVGIISPIFANQLQ